jgi:hypothetical protein
MPASHLGGYTAAVVSGLYKPYPVCHPKPRLYARNIALKELEMGIQQWRSEINVTACSTMPSLGHRLHID